MPQPGVPNRAGRLQFHLEVLSETAAAWARDDRDDLRALNLAAADIVRDVREAEEELRATWSGVIDRWLKVVAASR